MPLIVPSMAHLALSVGESGTARRAILRRWVRLRWCRLRKGGHAHGQWSIRAAFAANACPVGLREGRTMRSSRSRLALRQNRSRFAQLGMSGLAQKFRPAKA